MPNQRDWRRYVAPAAFLLAVTIAVVLVRSGLEHGPSKTSATTTTTRLPPSPQVSTTAAKREYWTVRAGDTFGVISAKTGVSIARIERLNPKVTSTSLFIGQKVRIR